MPDVESEITQCDASEAEADDRLRAPGLARLSGDTLGVHWSHHQTLAGMAVLRQSRLSVAPVSDEE